MNDSIAAFDKNMDKLITLCHKCHMSLDTTRNKMRNRLSPVLANSSLTAHSELDTIDSELD